MKRVFIALLFGAGLGVGLFVAFRPADTTPPATAGEAPQPSVAPAATPTTTAAVFANPTHPGVVVTVRRGAAPEANVKLELYRAEHQLSRDAHAWNPAGVERSDAEGRASFPATATLHLVVATATDGARATKAFDVGRAADATFVELELAKTQHLVGSVVDAKTRKPVPLATIEAQPGDERTVTVAQATADSFGKFALDVPEHARWTLVSRARGWQSTSETTKGDKPVELELTAGAVLEGRVVTAVGDPVESAGVRLSPGDERLTLTDREGRFSVTVPRAAVSVHATAPDGRQALARVTIHEEAERAKVELVLEAGSPLSGRVMIAAAPAADCDVHVVAEPESLEVANLKTNADGTFEAKALPKGRYSVVAQKGPARRATAVGLELPGAPPVELTLSSAGRLSGVVVDGARNAVGGATVKLSWPASMKELARTALTGDDGRFEFDELFPAAVTVQATVGDALSEDTETYVGPDASAEVVLSIVARGRLTGVVLSDKPVSRMLIRKEFDKAGEAVDVIDGGFDVMLAAGSYRLAPLVDMTLTESLVAEVRAGEVTTVTVQAGQTVERGDLMHPELGSGLSFENSPGGVRVDFLMADCPAAKAGVKQGDLVVSIDGVAAKDALDAFAKMRRPTGTTLGLVVRRDGQDVTLTLK